MVRIVFLLTFIFSLNGDCARITSLYLGQKDGGLFYGTTDPLLRQIGIGNEQDYIEQYNHKHFIDQFISLPIGQLEQSITKNLRNLDYCSNETLALLNEFFRYSHRLIALSYLYESIKKIDLTYRKLQIDGCFSTFKKNVKKCTPKSLDMMIFKANLVKYMSYDSKALIKSTFSLKDFKRRWESNKAQKKYFNLLSYLSLEKSKNELRLLCSKQINLFRYICSEEDSLYGMSYIPETYDLIARSNLLNVFRQRADGLSCLRKFRRIYEYREKTNLDLKRIFEYLFEKKKYEVNSREGEVFSLGALKEFLNKGITGLYEKKKTTKKVVVEAIKKTPIIVKKLSGNDVKQIIKKRTKKLSRNKKQKKNMIRIKRTSAFEDAFISLKRSGQKNIMINMDKFKYDLLFTLKLKRVLDEVLKPYLKRSSLMRMKNDDKLGTKDGPVPLTFLKYMIETAKHKELYSLIHLIGEKFIVVDDLNRKKRVHNYMISLINSKKTNFKWQIQLWR